MLARRAQQEEELHLKQVRMTEGQEQQMELERELRESQDLAERLQGNTSVVYRHCNIYCPTRFI